MNRVQRTAILAFLLLLMMAIAGWLFGGEKSQAADATPDVMTLDVSRTETIMLLPVEQRKQYVSADRFRAKPVIDPFNPAGGRTAGGEVVTLPDSDVTADSAEVIGRSGDRAQQTSSRFVRVRQGQTPSYIAQQELGDAKRWRELLAFNKLDEDAIITVGQLLYLPEERGAVSTSPIPDSGDSSGSGTTANASAIRHHKVQSGEYLGGISSRYYGTSKETTRILVANNLKNADQIRAGQVLVIPPRD